MKIWYTGIAIHRVKDKNNRKDTNEDVSDFLKYYNKNERTETDSMDYIVKPQTIIVLPIYG